MKVIIIGLIIWWIAQKLEIARRRRIQRIYAEQKERQRRQMELEREQARLAKEQERQAREQERQAEQLARHEAQVIRFEQRIDLAEREISYYSPILEELTKKAKVLDNKIWWYEQKGLPCAGLKQELSKIKEKAFATETRIIKARQAREFAKKQLAA